MAMAMCGFVLGMAHKKASYDDSILTSPLSGLVWQRWLGCSMSAAGWSLVCGCVCVCVYVWHINPI